MCLYTKTSSKFKGTKPEARLGHIVTTVLYWLTPTVAEGTKPFTLAVALRLTVSGEHRLLFPTQLKTQI